MTSLRKDGTGSAAVATCAKVIVRRTTRTRRHGDAKGREEEREHSTGGHVVPSTARNLSSLARPARRLSLRPDWQWDPARCIPFVFLGVRAFVLFDQFYQPRPSPLRLLRRREPEQVLTRRPLPQPQYAVFAPGDHAGAVTPRGHRVD